MNERDYFLATGYYGGIMIAAERRDAVAQLLEERERERERERKLHEVKDQLAILLSSNTFRGQRLGRSRIQAAFEILRNELYSYLPNGQPLVAANPSGQISFFSEPTKLQSIGKVRLNIESPPAYSKF